MLFFVHCSLFDKISIGIVCSNGPTILAELLVFFWYWLTQVVLEKEAVKGCWNTRDTTHLRDDVEVRDESTLQDDGNIGRVEQLDGIAAVLAAVASRLDR